MRTSIAAALALAALAGFALPAPANAQSAGLDTFDTTCNANPDFFSFAVTGLAENRDGLGRLCSCLVTEFSGLGDADLAMLTKDVDGTATPEDRTAFGDYTALELKARDALDKCLVAERLTEAGGTAPAGEMADMTRFDAACHGSPMLLEVIGGTAEEATPIRTTLCDCLSIALAPQLATADADILAQDLDGSATEESRAAYGNYSEAERRAGAAFDSCFATAMPSQ